MSYVISRKQSEHQRDSEVRDWVYGREKLTGGREDFLWQENDTFVFWN